MNNQPKADQQDTDRVRAHSSKKVNQKIDQEIVRSLEHHAGRGPAQTTLRIQQLEREWDVERVLETNASSLAMVGLALGVTTRNWKWLIVPCVVLPFLLQHALQGWCPPLPVLRSLGVRTRKEIDREKFALKALLGDFENIQGPTRAEAAAR